VRSFLSYRLHVEIERDRARCRETKSVFGGDCATGSAVRTLAVVLAFVCVSCAVPAAVLCIIWRAQRLRGGGDSSTHAVGTAAAHISIVTA
jgi:hypothetical protein